MQSSLSNHAERRVSGIKPEARILTEGLIRFYTVTYAMEM